MMSEAVKVAVDIMGGDNAPVELVKGAVEAINLNKDINVILVGNEEIIRKELSNYKYNESQVEIVHAPDVIHTGEPPVMAIRKKRPNYWE